MLAVVNRELKADFDPKSFDHVALWDDEQEWIEMRLRSRADQVVCVAGLELEVPFARGEELRTEVSAKFRPERLANEMAAAGAACNALVDRSGRRLRRLTVHPGVDLAALGPRTPAVSLHLPVEEGAALGDGQGADADLQSTTPGAV